MSTHTPFSEIKIKDFEPSRSRSKSPPSRKAGPSVQQQAVQQPASAGSARCPADQTIKLMRGGQHLTQKRLLDAGWTLAGIASQLGAPDVLGDNPYDPASPSVRLFLAQRVQVAQRDPGVKHLSLQLGKAHTQPQVVARLLAGEVLLARRSAAGKDPGQQLERSALRDRYFEVIEHTTPVARMLDAQHGESPDQERRRCQALLILLSSVRLTHPELEHFTDDHHAWGDLGTVLGKPGYLTAAEIPGPLGLQVQARTQR